MEKKSSAEILTLTNTQAKELAGRLVSIGPETYYFKNYDQKHPGQPPWRCGAEGKAYPLLGYDQTVAAYLKFFTRPTQKRLDRTAWLIGQQIHTWLPGLAAAPLVWVDTRHARRPEEASLDFAGSLARSVPGKTWLELKTSIHDNSLSFPEELRWRCVCDLILALSVLEQEGIVHGDLSPNNVVVDLAAAADQPALFLIDFDAFVAPSAEANAVVTVAEGGTYGTEGYCPPELAAAAAEGNGSVAPYSDRYGRDMLLMELLFIDGGLSPDDPPVYWDRDPLALRFAAWQARGDSGSSRVLCHLDPATLFAIEEQARPSSTELAAGLGLSPPARRLLRRRTQVWSSTPAVLGRPLAQLERPNWQSFSNRARPAPATLNFIVPWRWSRPASDPAYIGFWHGLKVLAIIALPFLVLLLGGILNLFLGK